MTTGIGRRAALGALIGTMARPAWGAPVDPMAALWNGIELQGPDGRTFGLRDAAAGRAKLLHLWAHWCPACLGEMASLANAAGALDAAGVDVLLVSHPEFWAADQAFARRHGLPFRLATPSPANPQPVLDAALLENSGAYTVPRSLLLDPAARSVAWRHMGALPWSSPTTLTRLQGALAGSPLAGSPPAGSPLAG